MAVLTVCNAGGEAHRHTGTWALSSREVCWALSLLWLCSTRTVPVGDADRLHHARSPFLWPACLALLLWDRQRAHAWAESQRGWGWQGPSQLSQSSP